MGSGSVGFEEPQLRVDLERASYRALIGTGGIGSGLFFALQGNHTLGREESRSGRFLDRRDYCKLHIISHYVQVLLGPGFAVIPIGCVGDDATGQKLLDKMRAVGLDMRHVETCAGRQTLFSICLVYPDQSGGNLTVGDSACECVDPALIEQSSEEFIRFAGRGIALAAPEVPLAARRRLLEMGSEHGFLRVAAFTTGEIQAASDGGMLQLTDLLAINISEAGAIAGVIPDDMAPMTVVEAALTRLQRTNPALWVSITAGSHGSWSWDGEHLAHVPAFPVQAVSTAGAGDAHLAGIIAGLVAGLALGEAQELGALVAALSVTSPHTIAPEVGRRALRALAGQSPERISAAVGQLLD